MLDEIKDVFRRNALHSDTISEVAVVGPSRQRDPEDLRVEENVNSIFEGFGFKRG